MSKILVIDPITPNNKIRYATDSVTDALAISLSSLLSDAGYDDLPEFFAAHQDNWLHLQFSHGAKGDVGQEVGGATRTICQGDDKA